MPLLKFLKEISRSSWSHLMHPNNLHTSVCSPTNHHGCDLRSLFHYYKPLHLYKTNLRHGTSSSSPPLSFLLVLASLICFPPFLCEMILSPLHFFFPSLHPWPLIHPIRNEPISKYRILWKGRSWLLHFCSCHTNIYTRFWIEFKNFHRPSPKEPRNIP